VIADPPGEPVLDLHSVSRSFASGPSVVAVLEALDLTVQAGEIVAVVGRSGSGKTTLLTLAAGFESPDAGAVHFLGTGLRPEGATWRDIALVPQALGLLEELTIGENVTLPMRLAPGVPREPAATLMERLGLDGLATRFPSEVSLGEQQRAAVARAAGVLPRLLIADEPLCHQNRAWADVMMEVLVELARGGTACLLATHDDVATAAAHRVLELRGGRLVPGGADPIRPR
jgi:ABC-type lipoprotein export system ATPase subunit